MLSKQLQKILVPLEGGVRITAKLKRKHLRISAIHYLAAYPLKAQAGEDRKILLELVRHLMESHHNKLATYKKVV